MSANGQFVIMPHVLQASSRTLTNSKLERSSKLGWSAATAADATGDVTLTVAELLDNDFITITSDAVAAYDLILPSTATILSGMASRWGTPVIGQRIEVVVYNSDGQDADVTAGDGSTTIVGETTIATTDTRRIVIVVTAATTLSVYCC